MRVEFFNSAHRSPPWAVAVLDVSTPASRTLPHMVVPVASCEMLDLG